MVNILLIEDDPVVATATSLGLRRLDHTVRHLPDGNRELDTDIAGSDVILLDLGLPGADGYELCRRIRAVSTIPIVMLTARSDDIDTVAGLEAGADDYVVKPASPRVLDARIKAVLRRTGGAAASTETPNATETFGQLQIDRDALQVRKGGELLALTPTEIKLLLALSANAGRVVSRQQLLEAAWDQDYLGDSRIVDAAVGRLRSKVEDDPGHPRLIETMRGFGYRLSVRRQ